MRKYSIDQTLSTLREIPESVEYEDVVTLVAAVPVGAAAGYGFIKLVSHFLKLKFLAPMMITTSTASLAIWYAVHTMQPAPSAAEKKLPEKPVSPMVEMKKDIPLGSATIFGDTVKKKMVKKQEIKIVKGNKKGALPPLPPLPPLAPQATPDPLAPQAPQAPMAPSHKEKRVIEREERIVQDGSGEGTAEADKDPMSDPFISALLDYLTKEGLLKNKDSFTIDLSTDALEVNSVQASKDQLKKAIQIFEEKEGEKFGKGSEIDIRYKKGKWSISKSIEN